MACEFQGDEIGLVLRALAKQAGMSVVISDRVQGTVTMRLEHTTPKAAMDVIIEAKALVKDEKDGVLFVKTAAERLLEPASRQLERTANDLANPVAHFKGQYYKALLEEGLPQSLAEELVRQETMSVFGQPHLPGTEPARFGNAENSDTNSDPISQWLDRLKSAATWSGVGLAILSSLPVLLINIAFSIAVYIAANRKRRTGKLLFFGPFLWAFVTIFNGLIGVAVYWLVNESAIARTTASSQVVQ